MTRPFHGTLTAVMLTAAFVPAAAAQAIAYGEPPPIGSTTHRLAEHYSVRLTSAWPELPASDGCENGGTETVEGTLTRTGPEDYAGTFSRTTHLLFCGAHGANGAACTLVLDGQGGVAMRGVVVADERSPTGRALRLAWTPAAEHGATVSGACSAEFKESVERMYLTARHGVEFDLPNEGAGARTQRLEDYAWVVEVR